MPPSNTQASSRQPGKPLNSDLGSNSELLSIIENIRAFDYDYATTDEAAALTRALKLVAADTLRKHEAAAALEARLTEQLAIVTCAAELSEVVSLIRPDAAPTSPVAPADDQTMPPVGWARWLSRNHTSRRSAT